MWLLCLCLWVVVGVVTSAWDQSLFLPESRGPGVPSVCLRDATCPRVPRAGCFSTSGLEALGVSCVCHGDLVHLTVLGGGLRVEEGGEAAETADWPIYRYSYLASKSTCEGQLPPLPCWRPPIPARTGPGPPPPPHLGTGPLLLSTPCSGGRHLDSTKRPPSLPTPPAPPAPPAFPPPQVQSNPDKSNYS